MGLWCNRLIWDENSLTGVQFLESAEHYMMLSLGKSTWP